MTSMHSFFATSSLLVGSQVGAGAGAWYGGPVGVHPADHPQRVRARNTQQHTLVRPPVHQCPDDHMGSALQKQAGRACARRKPRRHGTARPGWLRLRSGMSEWSPPPRYTPVRPMTAGMPTDPGVHSSTGPAARRLMSISPGARVIAKMQDARCKMQMHVAQLYKCVERTRSVAPRIIDSMCKMSAEEMMMRPRWTERVTQTRGRARGPRPPAP